MNLIGGYCSKHVSMLPCQSCKDELFMKEGILCKGSWELRSACGKCEKCIKSKPGWLMSQLDQKVAPENWISVHKRLPEVNQKIIGKSNTGEWTENFDPDEPLGNMTYWRPT